jgi:hypothetical protein
MSAEPPHLGGPPRAVVVRATLTAHIVESADEALDGIANRKGNPFTTRDIRQNRLVSMQNELDRCLAEVWPHRMLDCGAPRLADVQKVEASHLQGIPQSALSNAAETDGRACGKREQRMNAG